jgi:hypothetical protein
MNHMLGSARDADAKLLGREAGHGLLLVPRQEEFPRQTAERVSDGNGSHAAILFPNGNKTR